MTFTDSALERFYLFAKLLLKQLPFERVTLPREVMNMVDMDNFRVLEEQNGSIAIVDAARFETIQAPGAVLRQYRPGLI